jgi:hypothetical protein
MSRNGHRTVTVNSQKRTDYCNKFYKVRVIRDSFFGNGEKRLVTLKDALSRYAKYAFGKRDKALQGVRKRSNNRNAKKCLSRLCNATLTVWPRDRVL